VKDPASQDDIWWGEGSPNFEMDEQTFKLNRERAVDYLNMLDRIYVLDAFAGWDAGSRLKIRVVCGRPYHALFMFNMLVRPTEEELAEFGTPDFTIYNAGAFPANRYTSFMTSPTSIDVSLEHKEMVILGTQVRDVLCRPVLSCVMLCCVTRLALRSVCGDSRTQSTHPITHARDVRIVGSTSVCSTQGR